MTYLDAKRNYWFRLGIGSSFVIILLLLQIEQLLEFDNINPNLVLLGLVSCFSYFKKVKKGFVSLLLVSLSLLIFSYFWLSFWVIDVFLLSLSVVISILFINRIDISDYFLIPISLLISTFVFYFALSIVYGSDVVFIEAFRELIYTLVYSLPLIFFTST